MPNFLLELFSEEIPARMQARAADDLARLTTEALAALAPAELQTFHGPRRIALACRLAPNVAAGESDERGPRRNAPEQALAGFLRKHRAAREDLHEAGDYWVLRRRAPARPAAALIAEALPALLRRFPWPKSMRWGSGSAFTWIRPLRRILCLLDGEVVPFDLRQGDDDGHALAAAALTEGHRFLAPAPFRVTSLADWQTGLAARHVIVDAAARQKIIADGIARLAAEKVLTIVDDPALLDEAAGLTEWPVPLLGQIDAAYMDLPAEVMQVSMRVNQRYFALREADGRPAPWFAFAANIEAPDGGAAIVAGNERVLRARFADARHFWDLDRRTHLDRRLAALDGITFHARLGSQGDRARRLARLAEAIAPLVGADPALAARAALLAKADLTTGMVGEFPELQGVMGGYYAQNDGEAPAVAEAIRDHYAPKGPDDTVPSAPVTIAVALADKLDQLARFFAIGERPGGSGDPYALRRAALGVIRIIRENGLRLRLASLLSLAGAADGGELIAFLEERLRVQLRAAGQRQDVVGAVFAADPDDDFVRLLARADAVAAFLAGADGTDLLTAYRRAANILRIETRRDGPHDGAVDPARLALPDEIALATALETAAPTIAARLDAEDYAAAMAGMAALRAPVDDFFTRVTVNDAEPALRTNRLRLLTRLRTTMDRVADFSRIQS